MFSACNNDESNCRYKVYGYYIGDTIDNNFEITKIQDYPWSRAIYKKDERLEVWLIYNHISSLSLRNISASEKPFSVSFITNEICNNYKHQINETEGGLPINGETFYWYDSVHYDKVSLHKFWKQDTLFFNLTMSNDSISRKLFQLAGLKPLE